MAIHRVNRVTLIVTDKTGAVYVGNQYIHKRLFLKGAALPFLHLEKKGGNWIALNALDRSELPIELKFANDTKGVPRLAWLNGKELSIAAYTVVNADVGDDAFYHLDQLPDGTWRVCHREDFANEVDFVNQLTLEPE